MKGFGSYMDQVKIFVTNRQMNEQDLLLLKWKRRTINQSLFISLYEDFKDSAKNIFSTTRVVTFNIYIVIRYIHVDEVQC